MENSKRREAEKLSNFFSNVFNIEFMSKIDEIINFLTNDLNIKISVKKKELIFDKFYPNIKNRILWFLEIENDTTYGGILNKKHYEKMMTLSPETVIDIGIAPSKLKEISFKDDIDTLKEYYDNENYFEDKDIEYFDLINTDTFASIK